MDVATTPALQIDAIPLLARLSKDRVETLERHTTIRSFAAGERIFDEGEENPGRLYVVLDGEMSLCNRGKAFSTHTMDDYEIAAHGKNAVFGTISFLDGKPYSSSAYAKTPLTLAILDFSAAELPPASRKLRASIVAGLRRQLTADLRMSVRIACSMRRSLLATSMRSDALS